MNESSNNQYKQEELVICKNRIIDLRSGKLIPQGLVPNLVKHDNILNINYEDEADLKPEVKGKFLNYLRKLFAEEEIMTKVFEFLWLSLTDYELKVMQCHWGMASSGKSAFFCAVNYLCKIDLNDEYGDIILMDGAEYVIKEEDNDHDQQNIDVVDEDKKGEIMDGIIKYN